MVGWLAGGAAFTAIVGYASMVGISWLRYGRTVAAKGRDRDALLDRFMPDYEVAERHRMRIAAPADVVLAAAKRTRLDASAIARTIFRAREVALGATPDSQSRPAGLLPLMTSL
jgi:hypothetical protein